MRRNFMKSIVVGAAAMAGLTAGGAIQAAKTLATIPAQKEAVTPDKKKAGKQRITVNPLTGGLAMPAIFSNQFGMTPKEYGMRFGNGGSKKSNRNRYAHNAKLKRRNAA